MFLPCMDKALRLTHPSPRSLVIIFIWGNTRLLSGFLGEFVDPVTSRMLPWAPLIHIAPARTSCAVLGCVRTATALRRKRRVHYRLTSYIRTCAVPQYRWVLGNYGNKVDMREIVTVAVAGNVQYGEDVDCKKVENGLRVFN